jgi:hypothetical protein
MTDFRPVDAVVPTSLTVSADLAARGVGLACNPVPEEAGILEHCLRGTRGCWADRSLLAEVTAAIQWQLRRLFAATGSLLTGKGLKGKQSHHCEEYLTDSLQSHISSCFQGPRPYSD